MAHKLTRRYFLKLMLGSTATVGLSAVGGAAYTTRIEPHWLTLTRANVPIPSLPAHLDGFTIAQLSDLHRGPEITEQDITQAVELALREQTDLVTLTGDYVTGSASYAVSCAKSLSPLTASGDVMACLGNHDHWTDVDTVAGTLKDGGITVLRNAAQEVADRLWVAAVDDVWERRADLDKALDRVPTGATIVLLAHEPDYADEVASAAGDRISLQLSGHSHGGQIRLPFVRPPALPYLAEKYHNGQYRVDRMWLYVNRGVGMIAPTVRLNCRPEVTLLTLRTA